MFFPERKRKEFKLEGETAHKLQRVYVRVHPSTKGHWEMDTCCGGSRRMDCPAVKVYLKVSTEDSTSRPRESSRSLEVGATS